MSASQDIFRAYDIRGVYGEELDAEIGERVGLAFGNYLRRNHSEGKVSIGCDARVSSPELQEAVSVGISKFPGSQLRASCAHFSVISIKRSLRAVKSVSVSI